MNRPVEAFDMMPVSRMDKFKGVLLEDGHVIDVFLDNEEKEKPHEEEPRMYIN